MIESIFVQNLRSFRRETEIKIAPLTIFIGQNSAGKSSITRLIPLLKQSQEQRTSSLLLWNSSYVDYGNFDDVISSGTKSESLRLGLTLEGRSLDRALVEDPEADHSDIEYPVRYEIELGRGSRGRTRALRAKITLDDDIVELPLTQKGEVARVVINDTPLSEVVTSARVVSFQQSFVPQLYFSGATQSRFGEGANRFAQRATQSIAVDLEQAVNLTAMRHFLRVVHYRPRSYFREYAVGITSQVDPVLGEQISKVSDSVLERLRIQILVRDLAKITRLISDQITAEVRLSQYIGPIRSHAERYYRIQELAIDHIDPRGENVAMYLHFLTPSQLRTFNEIFSEAFGYTVHPVSTKGHVSLMIKEKGRVRADNIADVGFGFSQVLPVIAQLFAASSAPEVSGVLRRAIRSDLSPIIAVEQPELHLHPAYQAKLADLFTAMLNRKSRRKYRFIVETHSESLVNRIGARIAQGDLAADSVALYTFVKDAGAAETTVKRLEFNSDGIVENWPVGFFAAR